MTGQTDNTDAILKKSRKMQTDLAEREMWWVVQVLRHWDSLSISIAPFLPLAAENAAPNCIGFMPIFNSQDAAITWRDENHPTARVAAVVAD